ncbi:helix-turn-helix domain-containing protein [Herbiconiux sp. 11R-BC]|uniref:TetR/AcrR family transcriptional regulator n=1 Tax=Herbiconiux sp. 11R-BC TaxID=3111637 RepID=UPI003C0D865E
MESDKPRADRRTVALSKSQIVDAAVRMLDAGGVRALTFRDLAAQLSTGAGALYHHVSSKDELLEAAASSVMESVLVDADRDGPGQGVRTVMMGVFDTIAAHPWVGTQLAAAPWQPAVLLLFERVGSELDELGAPEAAQFDGASVLVQYLVGVASQFDAATRLTGMEMGRPAFLKAATSDARQTAGSRLSFLDRISRRLAEHDDRDQFRAGVEIILAGIIST